MNKLVKAIFTFLLIGTIFSSMSAFADSVTHKGKVKRIYVSSGSIKFRLYQESGCSPAKANHYYIVATGDIDYDEYYAQLLSAAHSGKSVNVNVSDTVCSDSNSHSQVNYIFQDF